MMNDTLKLRTKIALRIGRLRRSQGLTQKEVAEYLGINHLTYRGYENCKSSIPLCVLVRMADVFNVTLDYLLCREGSAADD